jgi:uncharacterized protein (UPF0335 family)
MSAAHISSSPKVRLETADLPRMEWAPIATVRPNPKNARTHSKKQIRQIAASIRKFRFLNPLIVDDENVILAGHGRLEGARLEGMAQVPIVRFGHLSEAQKRAYVIADNKIAEQAGWDRELLSIELNELIELLPIEGLDVSITSFETAEIDLLLADMGSSRPEPVSYFGCIRVWASEEGARMTNTAGIPGDRICSFIERVERIDEEIKALNEGKKEVFAEAKGEGFDVKVLREILRLRKQDKDERDEQESLLDLYLRAMESAGSSQAKAA